MNKKTLTFAALVIALSLSTDIDAFEKEFNHSGVIQKGLTHDEENNTTTFPYTDANGITKWYTIEGEVPSVEAPASFTATVTVLNGESEIEPFEKEFLHMGILQKGIIVDEATGNTTFKYANENGIVKEFTIEGEIPAFNEVEKVPAVAKKNVTKKAKKAVSKKAVSKTKKAVSKKAVSKTKKAVK